MASSNDLLKFRLQTLNMKQIKNLVRLHNLDERILLSKATKDQLIDALIRFYSGYSADGLQLVGRPRNLNYSYDVNPTPPRRARARAPVVAPIVQDVAVVKVKKPRVKKATKPKKEAEVKARQPEPEARELSAEENYSKAMDLLAQLRGKPRGRKVKQAEQRQPEPVIEPVLIEPDKKDLKKIASELGFEANIDFINRSFKDVFNDFMSIYASKFESINIMYNKNRIDSYEFKKRYKKLNEYIGIYKTPHDLYGKPIKRFDDFILESNKIYNTITSKEQRQPEPVPIVEQPKKEEKPQLTATDKALQTLIDMGLINDEDFEKMNISKLQEINKKQEKFSYNRDFVDESKISEEQFEIMDKGQSYFDFYKTPQSIINTITNSIISEFKKSKINILEPSAGLGSLMTGIINRQDELNINNLDANEFNEEMYNLLKENFKISHIYNKNFLNWTPEIKYDCIIMNPPYEGYVNEEVGRTKVAYLYHVMKAVLLGGNSKTIYAVLPLLKGGNKFELKDVISKADIKKMKNLFNIDEIPKVNVDLLMEKVDGWKKVVFSRGKFNLGKAGLSLNLYKFVVF